MKPYAKRLLGSWLLWTLNFGPLLGLLISKVITWVMFMDLNFICNFGSKCYRKYQGPIYEAFKYQSHPTIKLRRFWSFSITAQRVGVPLSVKNNARTNNVIDQLSFKKCDISQGVNPSITLEMFLILWNN